jgi:AAA+ ATPase superfamily predicted ATPase
VDDDLDGGLEGDMEIIGREAEQKALKQYDESGMPEFLVVYGRRRIGKTFLVREYFKGKLDFYATGLANGRKEAQLKAWNAAIRDSFGGDDDPAENWIDTFALLRRKLEKTEQAKKAKQGRKPKRKVLFIDEAVI